MSSQHLRDRRLQALVRVGDNKLDAGEAAPDERAQELAPERLCFCGSDVECDHLAPPRLVHAVGDNEAAVLDPSSARTFSTLPSSQRYG